jgi:hypothetical protein
MEQRLAIGDEPESLPGIIKHGARPARLTGRAPRTASIALGLLGGWLIQQGCSVLGHVTLSREAAKGLIPATRFFAPSGRSEWHNGRSRLPRGLELNSPCSASGSWGFVLSAVTFCL